ncbi:MAG TPA: thiamine pyrophosphate-dependent dehydrogenase E1 component subunit alpha, partial [Candidatus Limnocylindrales bacterium]|nr:thiamine pyrophosphate-dependent dehydrogenase E1 component subunit alpha [Candidatus Limnocylindrales bacterium]
MATTKVEPKIAVAQPAPSEKYEGLTPQHLIEIYRLMYQSRKIDDREIMLKRQQKIFFQISGAGHEALLVAAGILLRPGYDWFFPYYRDRALCLALGNTPYEQLLQAVGAADDPASGGRQMPSHWGNKKLNIVTGSSPTGTQFLQAVGCAEAGRYFNRYPGANEKRTGDYSEFKDVIFHGDEVVYVSSGDGTTSQGEFWESLSTASNLKLPMMFVIEDNEYAISVPVEVNTPGGNISKVVQGFPNFHFAEVDGTDLLASYAAMKTAIDYVRAGKGPAFVHGHVIRPYSHSLSDDEKLYRPESERKLEVERDPITRFRAFLLQEGILEEAALHEMELDLTDEVQDAADQARGRREDHGRPHQLLPQGRDEARPAYRDLWRGRSRLQPRRVSARQAGERQGRRLQAHRRSAERVRLRPRIQLAAGRSQHCRPRHRNGHARHEARSRDPVLRLHLARHAPATQRAANHPLALQQRILLPAGDSRRHRRIPHRRRHLSLAVRRKHLHPHAGHAR